MSIHKKNRWTTRCRVGVVASGTIAAAARFYGCCCFVARPARPPHHPIIFAVFPWRRGGGWGDDGTEAQARGGSFFLPINKGEKREEPANKSAPAAATTTIY